MIQNGQSILLVATGVRVGRPDRASTVVPSLLVPALRGPETTSPESGPLWKGRSHKHLENDEHFAR